MNSTNRLEPTAVRALGMGLLLAAMVAGCVNNPRDGQKLPYRNSDVPLIGATIYPNQSVALKMKNFEQNRFIDISQGARSGTSVTKDQAGVSWYIYESSARTPNGKQYWKEAPKKGSQRRIQTTFKVNDPGLGMDYTTFETNIQECVQQRQADGLLSVIDHCASPDSPEADVFVDCGKPGQSCCVAHDVPDAERCDKGRICSSSDRCNIRSGGEGQPCHGDGSCDGGRACMDDRCVSVGNLPVTTLELRVKTCDDSSWVKEARNSTFWVDVGPTTTHVEVPGKELQAGNTDRFGLRTNGVEKLSDITELTLGFTNRDWCVDRIELLVNERVAFRKDYSPSRYVRATYPITSSTTLELSTEELHAQFADLPESACDGPTRISGSVLRRRMLADFGHALVTSDDMSGDFDQGGGFNLRRIDESRVRVSAAAEVTKWVSGIGDVSVDASLWFDLEVSCSGEDQCMGNISCADASGCLGDNAVLLEPSNVHVDIGGGWAYDVVNAVTGGIVDLVVDAIGEPLLMEKAEKLLKMFGELASDLPACPTVTFGTSSPPDLRIGYPVICGTQTGPDLVNLCEGL